MGSSIAFEKKPNKREQILGEPPWEVKKGTRLNACKTIVSQPALGYEPGWKKFNRWVTKSGNSHYDTHSQMFSGGSRAAQIRIYFFLQLITRRLYRWRFWRGRGGKEKEKKEEHYYPGDCGQSPGQD